MALRGSAAIPQSSSLSPGLPPGFGGGGGGESLSSWEWRQTGEGFRTRAWGGGQQQQGGVWEGGAAAIHGRQQQQIASAHQASTMMGLVPPGFVDDAGGIVQQQQQRLPAAVGGFPRVDLVGSRHNSSCRDEREQLEVVVGRSSDYSSSLYEDSKRRSFHGWPGNGLEDKGLPLSREMAAPPPPPPPPPAQMLYHLLPPGFETKEAIEHSRRQTRVVEPPGVGFAAVARSPSPPRLLYRSEATFFKRGREEYSDADRERYQRNQRFIDSFSANSMQPPLRKRLRDGQGPGSSSMESDAPPPPRGLSETWKGTTRRGDDEFKDGQRRRPPSWSPPPRRRPPSWSPPPRRRLDGNMVFLQESRVKHAYRFRSPETLRPERGVASPRLRDRLKFPEDVPQDVSLHPKFNGPPPRSSSHENDTDHPVKRHDFLPKRKASYSPPPRGNDTRNSTGESHKGRRELQDMDNEDSPPRFTQRHKDSDTPTRIQQWVHPNREQPLSSDISVLKESSLDTPLSRKSRLGQGTIRQGSASGKSLLEGRLKYEGHPDDISGGTDLRKEEHHRDGKQHTRSFEGNHKEKSKVLKPEGKSSLSSKISITSPDLKAEGNTSWKSVSPIRQKISSGSEHSKRLGNGKMLSSSHMTSPQVCQEISSVLPSSQNCEAEKQETLNQAVKDRVPVASILSEQEQDFWHDANSDRKNMGVQEKSIKQGIKELSATPQHNSSPYPVPMVAKLSFNSDEKDSLSAREQGLATTKASSGKLMPGHSIVPKQQVVLVNCAEQMPRSKSLQPEKSRSTPSRRPSHSVEDGISLKKAESMEMDTGQPIKIGGETPHESQRLSQEWGEKQAMNENLNCGRPAQKVIYTGHKAENVKECTSGKTILGSTSVEVSDKLVVQEQIPSSLNSKQRSWSPSSVAATTENHGDQQVSLCTGKDRKCDSSSGLRSLLLFPEPSLQDKEKKKSQWLQTEEREVNIEILDLNIEEGNMSMSREALLSKLGTVKSSSEVGDLLLPDHLQENHPVSPIKIEISQPPTEKLVEQQFSNEKPERATPSAGKPVVSSVGPMMREVRLFGTNLIAAIPDAIEVEKQQRKRPLEVCEPSTQAQLPDFALPPVVDGNQSNTSPGKETIGAQEVIDASPQGSTEVVPTFDVHDRKEAIMVQSKEMVSPMPQFVQDFVAKGEAEDVKQVQINDCKPSEKETFISSREEIMVSDATARCLTDGDVVSAPDHHEIVQTEVHVQTDHGIEGTFRTGLSPSFKEVHACSPPGKSLQRAVGAAQLPQPRLGTGGSSASHPSGGNIWRRDSGAASNPSSLANTNQAAQRSTRGSVSVHRVAVSSTTTVNHQATIKQSGQRQSPKSANVPRPPTISMSTNTAVIKSSSLPTAPRSVVAPGSAAYVRKRKNTLVRFPAPPITGLPSTSVHVNVPSGPSRSTPMDIKDSAFTAFDPLSRSHVSRSSQLSDSTVTNSTGKMMTFHDTSRTGEHDIAQSMHPVSSSFQNTQVWPALADQSRSLPPISQSAVSGSEHLAAEILQDIARHTHTTKDTATVASNLLDTSTIRPSSSAAGNVPSGSRLYMRRKANQLVAAPLVQSSVVVTPPVPHSSDFTLGWPPVDVYVKRKTNQLVRNNIGKEISDKTGLQDGSVGRFADGLAEGSRQRRWQFQIQKTKLGRVLSQKKRPARGSSWVWTLGGESKVPAAMMSARGSSISPALFPWKRTGTLTPRLRRRRSLPEAKKGSLLFHLGKKLQGFRSAQPVYTRSADGFSLRRSGVVSQHGANLKWTKSLENRSKLASEAATKAVAEAEKKKRQRKEAVVVATTAAVKAKADKRAARKGVQAAKLLPRSSVQCKLAVSAARDVLFLPRCDLPGERIVWVGLVAYKMDSSRHTLQRLPDLQGPAGNGGTSALPGGLDTSALLTPKRSQIGGAVYVRVGSGNQLVRDPKTATRAFASEKVRWSLHNARFRRAKKQTFCQFYTRFGKCNKGDGKCPFIHDPDKVAVCTKFLKGSCDDSTCLLTHKVIPERMPDCSYFLEGLCTNESCPYRHVNVNPKAAVCEGFLRGYCADGDLCNKKHTYVCPVYAETGKCPLIGTCKLHHPKKKEQHIAPTKDHKITGKRKRRYFVTENPIGDQIQRDSSSKELVEPSDEIAEFISLNDVGAETFSNTVQEPERFGWRKKRLQLTSLLKHGEAVSGLETQLKPSFLLQKDKES